MRSVLPYFGFVWVLLSVVLFVQQGSRFSDLIFNTSLPDSLIWQLTLALIPNVIAFTGPIALLVGVVIGLSRMQGDSEMTVMRAAGVGNSQIIIPVVILGLLLSAFALFVNLRGVPFAAQIVRRVALQAALYKLQSPVDPGVFNTEIDNLTIFVKDGDLESGKWKNIFILQRNEDPKENPEDIEYSPLRLITAGEGFIGTKGEDSEIVLDDAQIVTLDTRNAEKYSLEKVKRLRVGVQTKRGEIIERLAKSKENPEEMGLEELSGYAQTKSGIEKTEALLLWQRRILLSITPLIFALLGAALVSKFNRGGRGLGIVLALVSLIVYYMTTLLGEQLARTGSISVIAAGAVPLVLSFVVITWLFYSRSVGITDIPLVSFFRSVLTGLGDRASGDSESRVFFSGAILDVDIIRNVVRNYFLTLGFLSVMYLLFTAFELWKFAGTIENGVTLLIRYLFNLIPFVYIQISPSSLMVAAIATYVIKSRQIEIVTWTAAVRSVYRLLLPCFVFAFLVGIFNFSIQESILNHANRVQDQLRAQIRSRNEVLLKKDGYWIAGASSIVTFEQRGASDNAKAVDDLKIYRFGKDKVNLESVTTADSAIWNGNEVTPLTIAKTIHWNDAGVFRESSGKDPSKVGSDPFQRNISKPSHLNIRETREKIRQATSASERRSYSVSLYKKYSTPFLPFILTLFTAPFALSIHRTGNVATIAYAAGLWLLFMGAITVFEQLGNSGFLLGSFAVGGPLVIFGLIGMIMLSRTRT
jgi:LPS export ABC transporter permease LptF